MKLLIKFTAAVVTLLAAVQLICLECAAENSFFSDYETVLYNTENGLDSTSANAVVQTDDGYIWVGTYTGLYRYDGTRFTLYDSDKGINSVRALFIDSRRRMWVGMNEGGAAVYNEDGSITFYSKQNGLSSNSVRSFCEDVDGNIYIGSTGALNVVSPDGEISSVTSVSYVNSLAASDNGVVAGVTHTGKLFFLYGNGGIKMTEITDPPDENYSCAGVDGNGDFLVGTSGSDIYRFKLEDGELTEEKMISLDTVSGLAVIKSCESGYWICADNGAVHLDNDLKEENLSHGSFNSNIAGITEDYQGNHWFVSMRQGVLKLTANPFVRIDVTDELAESVTNSVEIIGGYIYIAGDSGLDILKLSNGAEMHNDITERLEGVRVRQVKADSKGNVWISTYGTDGLICYKPSDGSFEIYNESTAGTIGSRFRFVTELKDGTVFAATASGMNYIKNGEVVHTIGPEQDADMPQMLCAVETVDGTILAGSDGDGIYGIKDGRVVFKLGEDEGLMSPVVMRIVKYKDFYFVVTGTSLYRLDVTEQEGGFKLTPLDSFVYGNNFDIITDEEHGEVWVTGSAGIYLADGDELGQNICKNYDLYSRKNGLDSSLTANSWNYYDNGNIYLCCSDGVRRFSSAGIRTPSGSFNLAVNNAVLADGTRIYPEKSEEYSGKFVIPPDAKRISFEAAALNYTLSDPELYIYLEGYDETGLYMKQSELKEISFTNLPYGTYYFYIGALSRQPGQPGISKVYEIEKQAQFYEQPVFKNYLFFLGVLMVAFITWAVTKIGNLSVIKQQYEEIRIAKEEAERANNAKSLFLANISHEIRTPINTMLGMNEMILRENKDSTIEKYALHVKSSGTTLIAIINDIIDVTNIESGRMRIVPENYDITQTIESLVATTEFRAREKKLEFKYEISPDIPKILYGDEVRLKQIVTNLLSNALKYTEKGSITLRIRCEEKDDDEILLNVTVEDTGIGIKDEDKERMFKEFERGNASYNSIEGTGLGLSITRSLLELMGSELMFISEFGLGSAFGFSLKQKKVSDERVGQLSFALKDKKKYYSGDDFIAPQAEILIVDDNIMNLEVAKSLLKKTQVSADTASSGKECIELVKKKKYDLIFLDHMMPEKDGIETLGEIRSTENLCRKTPVVVLTANAVSGAKKMYLKNGFDDYISKPVTAAELERRLVKFLPEELITYAEEDSGTETEMRSLGDTEFANVNVKLGMKYAGGNEKMYREVVGIYLDSSGLCVEKIIRAFYDEDLNSYGINVHSLKSTSLSIGAEKLSELARSLELAAKNGDREFVESNHQMLIRLYDEVIAELKDGI